MKALAIPLLTLLALLAWGCNRASAPAAASAAAHDAHADDHDHDHGPGEAHADHSPKHGGVFFMAPDKFHHVEGAYPAEGEFRLHLYDDHTQPIGPEGFSGRVELASGAWVALEPDPAARNMFARLDPPPAMPFDVKLWLTLPRDSQERLFDMRFEKLSVPGDDAHAHAHATGAAHSHGSPHGGTVVEAGAGHLELVLSGGFAMLYVLDANEATLPVEGITGSLMVQRATGAPETVALAAHGNHLMGDLALAPDERVIVVATLTTASGPVTARFAP
jgi:hypothetical protein